jgi:imidazolonepropionase-like amidohydrolase
LAFAVALSGCASLTAPPKLQADFVIENVNVVPMNEETILGKKAVAVKDGRIVAVLDQRKAQRWEAATRVDGGGGYLMPGLADMHVHTRSDPATLFKLYLANGVTTVRNLSDRDGGYDHPRIRADVASGRLLGPRYFIGGPFFDQNSIKGVGDVEPMLDLHVEKHFDYVKIHGDLPDDAYKAVMEGAKKRNLLVTGHVQRHRPLHHSLGMYSIEHAEEFLHAPGRDALRDPALARAAAVEIKKSGMFVVPTLAVFKIIPNISMTPSSRGYERTPTSAISVPSYRELAVAGTELLSAKGRTRRSNTIVERRHPPDFGLTRTLHEAGVPLILATDVLGALVQGFSPPGAPASRGRGPYSLEALRTGTVNVAAYLREPDAGTLQVGKRADFILVGGNPLRDIKAAADVRGVFVRNRWLPQAELKAMLESVPRGYLEAGREYAR